MAYVSPEQVAEVIHDVYMAMMSGKEPGDTEYVAAIARNFTVVPAAQVGAVEAAIRSVFGGQQLDLVLIYDGQPINDPALTVTNVSVGIKVLIASIDA